jgi:hypothetical protein
MLMLLLALYVVLMVVRETAGDTARGYEDSAGFHYGRQV